MPAPDPRDRVLHYHSLSTHRPERFAPGPGGLDWATQPDPFRSYDGAPTVELPLADAAPTTTWGQLHRPGAVTPARLDLRSLGASLELALGLTAWKEYGASRWSLRANPSSGNLHPTEGYVLVPGVPGLEAGLYHYLSRDHLLERRWMPAATDAPRLGDRLPPGGFLVGLTSIHWREAWKYGERAFRYCQHDAGHALAAVRYSAAVLGWTARLLERPGDAEVATLLGLDREEDLADLPAPDREHPDLLVAVAPPTGHPDTAHDVETTLDALVLLTRRGTWTGRPNALSPAHVAWPEIEAVSVATRKPPTPPVGPGAPHVSPHSATRSTREGESRGAVALIRQRRSAVAMDGRSVLPAEAFFGILDALLPRSGVAPWDVLPWGPRVHPVLLVHRVDGLSPGLYLLERDVSAHQGLRAATRPAFVWERVEATPASLRLFLLEEGDARSLARFASCQQSIASESAFSLGMLSLFESSLEEGPWWYRRLFWESGVLGQVLYLQAEAAGLRGTGIGCYFDDVVHELLGLDGRRFQDLYHFTVGGPVDDPRLATRPAYPAAVHER
jgi:SagB-type dehydrogenase family enzyme